MSEPQKLHVDHAQDQHQSVEIMARVRVVGYADSRIQALGHVLQMIDEFADASARWTLPNAVKSRSNRLIERVLRHIRSSSSLSEEDKSHQVKRAIFIAAAMGNLPLVQQLYDTGLNPLGYQVAGAAALNGDLPLLKWIQAQAPELLHQEDYWAGKVAFYVAVKCGCLDTVQWVVETLPEVNWPLGPAALGGHLNVVKWLHEHANLDALEVNLPFGFLNTLTFALCLHSVEE